VGRNVWQHSEPVRMAEQIRKVIFHGKPACEALAP